MTTVDINRDSNTDVLLVGAPMFMGAEKEEQGKVYVYSVNQVMGKVSPEALPLFAFQIHNVVLIFHRLWEKEPRRFPGPPPPLSINERLRILIKLFKPLAIFCFENVNCSFLNRIYRVNTNLTKLLNKLTGSHSRARATSALYSAGVSGRSGQTGETGKCQAVAPDIFSNSCGLWSTSLGWSETRFSTPDFRYYL